MRACPSIEAALSQLGPDGTGPLLRVEFPDNVAVTQPGIRLSSAVTKSNPRLFLPRALLSSSPASRYTAACLDLDAPFPSFSVLAPVAHWIALDLHLHLGEDASSTLFQLLPDADDPPPLIPYVGPGPPPPSAPHRYVFAVWEQPEGVLGRECRGLLGLCQSAQPGVMARMRWDQTGFEKRLGLGAPLAVNYFVASAD